MDKLQFRVLYREFLFRMVDVEVLSPQAQGDMNKLFGQFASLLIWFSVGLAMIGLGARGTPRMSALQRVLYSWGSEHFLIAATMLVVGLFAVLSWDSTFPNKRDVMVLAPLPIRSKTLFLAKIAGVAAALALTVVSLHLVAQLTWPASVFMQPAFTFEGQAIPASGGFGSLLRTFAAYWITMFAAGAFVFCCALGVQGLAALVLTRRLYLRASAVLQLAAFCALVCGFCLEPTAATPKNLAAAQGNGLAAWQFSFWFLGLFQQLKGSPALPVLAHRAWLGLGAVICITGLTYALSYFRMLRTIVEEPDIAPGVGRAHWLPGFGNALETAVGQFSVRSLLRSRQHRVIIAFYLGIGVAFNLLFLSAPAAQKQIAATTAAWSQVSPPLLATTILMMLFSIAGTRLVFAMPLDLKANWIFRITPVSGGGDCIAARRRAMLAIGVLPVWIALAALLFSIWPWRPAAAHLTILCLLGAIVAEVCLQGFQKIPFTCSYLPGKTGIHMMVAFTMLVFLQFLNFCAGLELRALHRASSCFITIAIFAAVLFLLRRLTAAETDSDDLGIQFEDEGSPAIQGLGLAS